MRKAVKKYFIAIVIPEPLMERIEDIKRSLFENYGLKGALRSPSHITLHRPFEWIEEKEAHLIEKLAEFKFDKAFEIALNGYGFFEPRVIYIKLLQEALLFDLHDHLKKHARMELKLLNEVNDLRGFHPHITVAFRDLKKPLFYELQTFFKDENFEGKFFNEGFSLLKFEGRWEEINFFKWHN